MYVSMPWIIYQYIAMQAIKTVTKICQKLRCSAVMCHRVPVISLYEVWTYKHVDLVLIYLVSAHQITITIVKLLYHVFVMVLFNSAFRWSL